MQPVGVSKATASAGTIGSASAENSDAVEERPARVPSARIDYARETLVTRTCLVTGGAGFIGCAISRDLADAFDRVFDRVLDRHDVALAVVQPGQGGVEDWKSVV